MAIWSIFVPVVGPGQRVPAGKAEFGLGEALLQTRQEKERSEERFAGSRGKPFWKRGGELLARLRLRRPVGGS